ncbi:hypothetical protein LSM04_009066 [Trypanosoma melophagium]|uniref:uncharacterized protein n=1 Tax=Trypanosoma melophagium TaxID=715481 RepID=UPI003519EB1C|nr:hypothetical protein LSM04_009066 [Trypanosoma melophagium]
MTHPSHLGVLCVDVSELLKAPSRLKVQRRDNMLLYRKSYLITDPLPVTTAHSSVGKRTPHNSPSRNSNAGAGLSRNSSNYTSRRRRGSSRRSRSSSSSSRKRRGDKDQSDDDTKNDHATISYNDRESGMFPSESDTREVSLITSGVSTPKRFNSKRDCSFRKPYKMTTVKPEEGRNNSSSSVFGWRSGKRVSIPLNEFHDAEVREGLETPRTGHKDASMEDSSPVNSNEHSKSKVRGSKTQYSKRLGQQKYNQDYQTEWDKQEEQQSLSISSDPHSNLSESAQRTINFLLASMQQRVWENAHKMHLSPFGTSQGGKTLNDERTNYDVSVENIKEEKELEEEKKEEKEEEDNCTSNLESSTGTLHVTMIGPMGVGSVPPSPNPWPRTRIQSVFPPPRRSPTSPRDVGDTASNKAPHRLIDKNGKERVLLMGVVPTLPKPVLTSPIRAKRGGGTTSLPPVFRRAARVTAVPSNRPKRF